MEQNRNQSRKGQQQRPMIEEQLQQNRNRSRDWRQQNEMTEEQLQQNRNRSREWRQQNEMTEEHIQQNRDRCREWRQQNGMSEEQLQKNRNRISEWRQKNKLSEEKKLHNRERSRQWRQKHVMTEEQRQKDRDRAREWRQRQSQDARAASFLTLRQIKRSTKTSADNEMHNIRRRKAPPPSKYIGRNDGARPSTHYLGNPEVKCVYCEAYHFLNEKTCENIFGSCCGGGKIMLDDLQDYPKQFQTWLTTNDDDGKNFVANIRKYNSACAFASFGCQPVKFTGGPPAFVIHGQVYHKTISSLTPPPSTSVQSQTISSLTPTPSTSIQSQISGNYSQLYFLDPEFANNQRFSNPQNTGVKRKTLESIDRLLREINPFAAAFRMMKTVIDSNNSANKIEMWITTDRRYDQRRYNLPNVCEVAAIFVSEDGEPPYNRDIAIHPIGTHNLQSIKIISPNCDPMVYPLLFPYGEPGWQPEMKQKPQPAESQEKRQRKRVNISMLEFYSYRIQEREKFSPLLHARKLTQQFIIDAFMKVEGQRLEFNRRNQKQLRVDLYMGLMDFVNSRAENQGSKPGRIVILPSSFHGGKRAFQQNYQDAMALVAKYGKPDLFITFTCNPKWPEIQENLKYDESAIDRTDLVATVFNLKLKEFLNDLTSKEGGIFGKVKAFVYVIEFQKRGLPHCHMLLILTEEDKFRTPEEVDEIVCAEIPDETNDPELYKVVTSCMIHGPCGISNKTAPCMQQSKGVLMCSKQFPKEFCNDTNTNVNGYPLYRRRQTGNVLIIRGSSVDNRWVVPYNPYLSRKFNAHINVEVCSSVQSVKYIFKYVYKGHDAAFVQVNQQDDTGTYNWDEITAFLDTRYIAAPEAMWRLRKYDMSARSHSIERLPVHLPSQQTVYFHDGLEEKSLREAESKGTKLTKWFLLNQTAPKGSDVHKLLYSEIPYKYVWRQNSWLRRQKGEDKVLPRLYAASLKDMERFCLRLLLMHIRGAKSFKDLRTVRGILYPTFQDAAKAMGLLDDDTEWDRTMEEAVVFQMPSELRFLFSTILLNVHPSNCLALYKKFRQSMLEDYAREYNLDIAEQRSLNDIQGYLTQFGKVLRDFGLPTPVQSFESAESIDISYERDQAQELLSKMNREQRFAFNTIINAVENRQQKCFFLSGAGGCGKTYVYKALISKILGDGGLVRAVAPTGLAATLLKGGKTVHSGFGIPISLNETTTSHFKQGSVAWKELMNTKLIIWDEISMCHAHLLNAVDRSLKFLLNSDQLFGGIPIVVGGDFQQQAPVIPHGTRVQVIESCVKSSCLWKHFKELKLLQNMRVNDGEAEFCQWLLQIGAGKQDESQSDFVKMDDDMLTDDVVKAVFGSDVNSLTPNQLASMAILCPKNNDTLQLNEQILGKLHGDAKSYYSVDKISDCETEEERLQYPAEFLNSITPMGLPPHELKLKKGCCVMLLRNLNPKKGLCNGTRLIVESLGTNLLECSIFSGQQQGKRVLIPRIPLDTSNSEDLPFKLNRKQFPIRLAYSITITKSQGQTFDKIGLYLPQPVFSHGQLYTALSRVKTKSGLAIQITAGRNQGQIFEEDSNTYTYNCVYKQILE